MKNNPLALLPSSSSNSDAWIKWHKALKKRFGIRQANETFLRAWQKRGSNQANNTSLRNYMKSYDVIIEPDNFFENVGDTVGGFFGAIGNVFKMGAIGSVVILGLVVVGGVITVVSRFSTGAALRKTGKALAGTLSKK